MECASCREIQAALTEQAREQVATVTNAALSLFYGGTSDPVREHLAAEIRARAAAQGGTG
jgi:hypothetical protein